MGDRHHNFGHWPSRLSRHSQLNQNSLMKLNKDVTHSPKELLDDLQALVVEAETMMAGSISEHSAEALKNLRLRFAAAKERFGAFYDTARERVVAGVKCTDTVVRENPYQSIAIVAGVSVLVGLLLGRRSK
jgi:ElaB/YqjD/DUF883 family membrane-anchored ribosome-binding protein